MGDLTTLTEDAVIEELGIELLRELHAIRWFCDAGGDGKMALISPQQREYYAPGGFARALVDLGCVRLLKKTRVLNRWLPAIAMEHFGRRLLCRCAALQMDLEPERDPEDDEFIAPIAPEPGEVEGLVKALEDTIAWASGKCPCANEMPDPCTLCGARVDGDRCLVVESVFPRALLTNVCAALAAYKAKEAAQVPTELTPLHMEMLRRGVMYERIGLTDEAGRHLVEIGALRDLRGMGLVDLIHEPELPGPPRPSSFTITEAGRAAYKAKEAGNG